MVNVYIKVLKHGFIPFKATEGSSGFDLILPTNNLTQYAINTAQTDITLYKIPLGFALDTPEGYEAQIRLRSSCAAKGMLIPNSPATIDSDYRGEVQLLIYIPNSVSVSKGDKLAQLVFQKVPEINLLQVDELSDTIRGSGGFGSTNIGTDNV